MGQNPREFQCIEFIKREGKCQRRITMRAWCYRILERRNVFRNKRSGVLNVAFV